MKGVKVSIPMVNYRSHKSYTPDQSRAVDTTLSDSAHDLEYVMTVSIPNGVTPGPIAQTYGDEEYTRFFGGDVAPVADWQFNYADRCFPPQTLN
jgi:hypothetical protein